MAPTDVPKKERSLSYRLHDALNVPLVGGLAIMCILGLLGLMDAHLITKPACKKAKETCVATDKDHQETNSAFTFVLLPNLNFIKRL